MTDAVTRRAVREPSLADAVIPLVALVVLIGGSLALCFFNIASPLLSVIYGFTGFKIEKVEKVEPADA